MQRRQPKRVGAVRRDARVLEMPRDLVAVAREVHELRERAPAVALRGGGAGAGLPRRAGGRREHGPDRRRRLLEFDGAQLPEDVHLLFLLRRLPLLGRGGRRREFALL